MRKILFIFFLALLGSGAAYIWINYRGIYYANKPSGGDIVRLINQSKPGQNDTTLPLKVPENYYLSIYASGLENPRDLTLDPNGVVVASLTSAGKVVAILDNQAEDIVGGLSRPHGIVFFENRLYVGETDKVSVFEYDAKNFKAFNKRKIIDLPGGGGHFTRSLLIKDGKLYTSIGSSCNVCTESDPRRASIWQSNLDGSDFTPYATGLRNSVFLITNPNTNEIWATNMGRDNLGDDLPPDTVNIIKEGANYGWPYCYGNKITDTQLNPGNSKFDCSKMEAPKIELPAHSAPLGLAFLGQDLLIAYHGSWNKITPTGYKVVKYSNGKLEDFISGWLEADGSVLGRPVDILVKESNIFISDDKAGVIYLLTKI